MKPEIFGILNVTPDSIFDAGVNIGNAEAALRTAHKLIDSGAQYIDIGAEATNPKAQPISVEEEISRLAPVLPTLFEQFPNRISVDTYKPEVIKWILTEGFGRPIVNDVTGLYNPYMVELVAHYGLRCVIGTLPASAEGNPFKAHHVEPDATLASRITQVESNIARLTLAGVPLEESWIDACIGFGTTRQLDWQLLSIAHEESLRGYKVLSGHSRKRFLAHDPRSGNELPEGSELKNDEVINRQAAVIALNSGAVALRVHDPQWYPKI